VPNSRIVCAAFAELLSELRGQKLLTAKNAKSANTQAPIRPNRTGPSLPLVIPRSAATRNLLFVPASRVPHP
jgi:hypothetical protein